MKSINFVVLASLALALVACGSEDSEPVELSDQPASGVVGGESWTFAAGHTSAFLSDDDDFFAVLYPESFEACGFSEPGGDHLLAAIPTAPGVYELDLSLNMTFVVGNDNLVATNGLIVVDSVTDDTVSGSMYARFDGDNELNGTFSLTICSE